jgi:hypothetical protein
MTRRRTVTAYLYQDTLPLNNQKVVSGVTLPANGSVVLLAVDLLA